MHLREQIAVDAFGGASRLDFGREYRAGIVAIGFHGERDERHEIDSVAVFESLHVAVAQRYPQHVGDAGIVAGGGAHPEGIVVAPLDIEILVLRQRVHYQMCARPAVIDIAKDVELVDGQTLYDIADGYDERPGLTGRDYRLHDAVVVELLAFARGSLMEKFLDYIGELARERLAHFRARIFRRHTLEHLNQTVERYIVEILEVGLFRTDNLEFLLGIIDQRAELRQIGVAHTVAVDLAHLSLDISRGIAENMAESLILAVEVGHEMLRALRQVQNRFEIDNLGARSRYIRERL